MTREPVRRLAVSLIHLVLIPMPWVRMGGGSRTRPNGGSTKFPCHGLGWGEVGGLRHCARGEPLTSGAVLALRLILTLGLELLTTPCARLGAGGCCPTRRGSHSKGTGRSPCRAGWRRSGRTRPAVRRRARIRPAAAGPYAGRLGNSGRTSVGGTAPRRRTRMP